MDRSLEPSGPWYLVPPCPVLGIDTTCSSSSTWSPARSGLSLKSLPALNRRTLEWPGFVPLAFTTCFSQPLPVLTSPLTLTTPANQWDQSSLTLGLELEGVCASPFCHASLFCPALHTVLSLPLAKNIFLMPGLGWTVISKTILVLLLASASVLVTGSSAGHSQLEPVRLCV